ncbi:MAG: EAL domain-containing protein [Candidatus Thiodiazotropha sp.]
MLMEDRENVINSLHPIHDLGVHLSIDDFGTGDSSLSYLKRLPVDQLKIDKAFVQDMLTDPGDAIIACSIVTLGRKGGYEIQQLEDDMRGAIRYA